MTHQCKGIVTMQHMAVVNRQAVQAFLFIDVICMQRHNMHTSVWPALGAVSMRQSKHMSPEQ